MLTQIQLPEPQAALLAACPRPRAVALSAVQAPASVITVSTPEVSMSTQRPRSQWRRTQPQSAPTMFAAASGRVVGLGAVAVERPAAPVRPAYAAAIVGGIGREGFAGVNGLTSSKQDEQHLTDRRGPVTWRPPR